MSGQVKLDSCWPSLVTPRLGQVKKSPCMPKSMSGKYGHGWVKSKSSRLGRVELRSNWVQVKPRLIESTSW